MRAPMKRGARPAATGHAPHPTESLNGNTGRLIVPQLEELAELLTPEQLFRVRTQVTAGERVAIYVRRELLTRSRSALRVLITGPERRYSFPPSWIDGEWQRLGIVEITDDGERALPEACS